MSTQQNFLQIPLAKLAVSPLNVRTTDAENVDDLIASIPVHGLLQSLVIVPAEKDGHYHVIAGGRRLRALQTLAKNKQLEKGYLVPCRLADSDQDQEQISLAENVIRAPMHPADQYRAFAAQIDAGKSIEDVAQAFGVSQTVVKKRMKLGKVAPEILAAYTDGKLEFEQVAAYAISDDQERQCNVFTANPRAHSHAIRTALTEGEVPVTDKRVKLVGLEAYQAAGGVIHQDLFAEGDRGIYLTDAALLDQLAAEKIDALINEIKAEGWQEVFFFDGQYWELEQEYKGRVYPQNIPLSEEQSAAFDALVERMGAIEIQLDKTDDDALYDEYKELSEQIDSFKTSEYLDEDKARASAAIVTSYNGDIRIERGLLKSAPKTSGAQGTGKTSPEGLPTPSAKMQNELAAVRTAAIAADLCSNAHVALAITVHSQAATFFGMYASVSASTLKAEKADAASHIQNQTMKPLIEIEQRRQDLRSSLPPRPADWWTYFLEMSQADLLQHLAVFTALSLRPFGQYQLSGAKVHGDQIADALGTTPEAWMTLSDLGFLERSTKTVILAAVEQIKGKDLATSLAPFKKTDLVERATAELDGAWLPAELTRFATDHDCETVNHMDGHGMSHFYGDQEEDGEDDDEEEIAA